MAKELAKTYDPSQVEDKHYKNWEQKGYFHADVHSEKPPFSIVIPPPNVTGQLHMGHAIDDTIQDILIRYKKLQGFEALWVPGMDHAGIATQIKVEEMLRVEEGKTRYDLGREEFLRRVWEWKEQYGGRIVRQLRRLGAACDWQRERFTMDEGCSRAVREVFVNLYNKGLIYRGYRIINWCPHCITALSDAEVEYEEQEGNLWHIRYPLADGSGDVVVATTRPETMLGDSGIAVSPEDERYAHLIGKSAVLPLVGREIPIFADEYVDKSFGTGCVKVTPCHDPNDYEMGLRHDLEQILVIDDYGKINENGGVYEGLERYEARRRIVADLEEQGYLVKIEKHVHNVGQCYRCGTTVEPLASRQWFVKMKPLAEPAIDVVKSKEVNFVPERFEKIYLNWMENVRDWCISRQLWWGHRIPAFYCDDCGEMTVAKEDVTVCPKCGSHHVRQEEDVLDTWFSSALWPFSTLGWPDRTEDLAKFYPTSVLVTAYDIIFFWVARMIFSGLEHMGEKPFSDVFIHGLIRDAQGRKMSKSLGNGIDPLEVIEQYGADALRFALVTGNSPGNDTRFSKEKVESARNFANKLWNASRFVLMNLTITRCELPDELELEDRWILSRYNDVVREVTDNLDHYEIGVAVSKLYDFLWDDFCDWYIELAKLRLFESNPNEATRRSAQQVLCYVLSNTLKLLHPVMPFITEEIYLTLPHACESIMLEQWPRYSESLHFAQEQTRMERVMEAIKAIRNRRSEMNVPPSKKAKVYIETEDAETFRRGAAFFERLASASEIEIGSHFELEGAVSIVTDGARIFIPLDELVDREKELARLAKEKKELEGELARIQAKLQNEGFLKKAPAALVDAEREKQNKVQDMLEKLEQSIRAFDR
ncbi:valine--tRNA ligase [Feifania hominis]|uniref:Valine--tRNA ligase n=1 Tax=Feifania hominis TaxID=2763660 RepID=A0A926DCP7_9FIRM|nr:valine--tRNA ligase [Feifania hominis]MBC8535447.1 valine--tRNA ligase [Feifania hominis]